MKYNKFYLILAVVFAIAITDASSQFTNASLTSYVNFGIASDQQRCTGNDVIEYAGHDYRVSVWDNLTSTSDNCFRYQIDNNTAATVHLLIIRMSEIPMFALRFITTWFTL